MDFVLWYIGVPYKAVDDTYCLIQCGFGRGGFVETAMRAGVPIVPIALMGTEDTTPVVADLEIGGRNFSLTLNSLLFGPILGAVAHFPAKIRARVLAPIRLAEAPEWASYPRSLLMERAEQIRGDLQLALYEMLAARESKWFG